jgi:WD40 repeat protein
MVRRPYKFLDAFEKEDHEIFFGRQREIEEIHSRLFYSNLLVLYGPSGTGKTSILKCGLTNRIPDSDWKPVLIRRNMNIIQSIGQELHKLAQTPLKSDYTIQQKLRSVYLDYLTPVFLIFDQLEELFVFGDQNEQQEFARLITSITSDPENNVKVIFIIREEYLADLSSFEEMLPHIFDNRFRIERMGRSHILEAIKSPAEVCSVKLDDGLAEEAIEKITDEKGNTELTYVQVLMDHLYKVAEARDSENIHLQLDDLRKLGQLSNLMSKFLDDQLLQMENAKAGEDVLKTMISLDGTKKPMRIADIQKSLQQLNKKVENDRLLNIVQFFVNVRILREKDENGFYELRHDSLAVMIFSKMTTLEKDLIEIKQFIEIRFQEFKKRGIILDQESLDFFNLYLGKLNLHPEIEQFLKLSAKLNRKNAKRKKQLRMGLIASAFIALISFTVWNYAEKKKADIAKAKALSSASLTRAYLTSSTDPTESMRYAIEALEYYEGNFDAQVHVVDLYNNQIFYNKLVVNDQITSTIDLPKSGDKFLLADHLNRIKLYDMDGNQLLLFPLRHTSIIEEVLFFQDNDRILSAGRDGRLIIWSSSGEVFYESKSETPFYTAATLNNNYVIAGDYDGNVSIYNAQLELIVRKKLHVDSVGSIAINNRNQLIASVARDRKAVVMDISGNVLKTIELPSPARAIAFVEDKLVVGDFQGNILLYNDNGDLLQTIKAHTGALQYLQWESEFKRLISTGTDDGLIKIWNERLQFIQEAKGHKSIVRKALFFQDGTQVMSAAEDGTILVHFLNNPGNISLEFPLHGYQWIERIGMSDKFLFGDAGGSLVIIDENLDIVEVTRAHEASIRAIAVSNNSELIVSASVSKDLKFWNSYLGPILEIEDLDSWVNCIYVNDNMQMVVAGLENGSLMQFDFQGNIVSKQSASERGIYDIVMVGDTLIASVGLSREITFTNAISQEQFYFNHGARYLTAASTINDDLLIGGAKHSIMVFDIKQRAISREFGNHNGQVYSIVPNPDNKRLITSDALGMISIWYLPEKKHFSFSARNPSSLGKDAAIDAAFASDGSYVLTITYSGYLKKTLICHEKILVQLKNNPYF